MSLNCVGSQLLQTPPSPLLAGASTASLSIWIRVNPGNVVADPAGVLLFGDGGGKLAVGLSASGDLRVGWSSHDGNVDAASKWEQPLLPGVAYHVAATWQEGAQKYYVNGVPVSTDARRGSLGRLGDSQAHPFRIGSDVAGVDVTLDEATLWVGHALAPGEVVGLRDRLGHPEGVAPESIALRWSLAGPDGQPARAGDAGLSDASATGLNLVSTVGAAPTYRGGVLSFAPEGSGWSASVCPSGRSVLFLFRDEATLPRPVRSLSTQDEIQSITLNGKVAGGRFTLSLDGRVTAPIATTANPPVTYFEWVVALGAAGAYDIAADPLIYGNNSPATLYEVFDGEAPIGSVVLDLTTPTGLTRFGDGSGDGRGPGGLVWTALGRYTFASKTARVRVSAPKGEPNGVVLYADSLRVASADGATVRYAGPQVPPGVHANPLAGYDTSYPDSLARDGGRAWHDLGSGAGSYDSLDASAVRAALEALPNVGVGNVSVSGNGSISVVNSAIVRTPLLVSFVGDLAKRAIPLLVPSDPAVTASRTSAGGNWPRISINGAPPVALTNPIWGMGHGDPSDPGRRTNDPYSPFVLFPLIQSAPEARYEPLGSYQNTFRDGGGFGWESLAPGFSPTPWKSSGVGPSATWRQEGLPAGRYRISATWAADAGNTTDATFVVTNRARSTLATYHANQAVAPEGAVAGPVAGEMAGRSAAWHVLGTVTLSGLVDDLIVTMTNGSGGAMVADSIRFERVSPDTSVRIAAGDVVTYSAGFGWATTAEGPAPAVAGGTVLNNVGGTIAPAVPATVKSMGCGWNVNLNYTSTAVRPHANHMASWSNPDPLRWPQDADGNLTRFTGPAGASSAATSIGLVSPFGTVAGYLSGGADVPSGRWTLLWRGATTLKLSGTEVGSESVAPDGSRMRVFDNQPPAGSYSPSINLVYQSTTPLGGGMFGVDAREVRVYPPGANLAAVSKYNPGFLARTNYVQVLRWLDPLNAIAGNNVDWADINPPQSRNSRYERFRRKQVGIASTTAYPFDGAHRYDPLLGPAFLFTTTGPHGMSTGFHVQFRAEPGPFRLSDGTSQSVGGYEVSVVVHSSTTFSCQFGVPRPPKDSQGNLAGSPIAMVGTVGDVGGTVYWDAGNSFPVADMVELCNLANFGAGADIYVNVGITWSDACLASLGNDLALHLKPGRRVFLEFSNEPWNTYSPPYSFLTSEGYAEGDGSNYIPTYCRRSSHAWAVVRSAMAAAVPGRGADLVGVLGGCSGDTSKADSYAAYFGAHPELGTIGAVALAPYISNAAEGGPNEVLLADLADLLTHEQDMDWMEANHAFTDHNRDAKAARSSLDARGFTSALVIDYEGGPSGQTPYIIPGRNPSRCGERTHAGHRSPRENHFIRSYLRGRQDAGVSASILYYLAGGSDFVQQGGFAAWSACTATDQQEGTGDPILDAANVASPDRMDLIKSETAGALKFWGSLVGRAVPPKPPARKRPIPVPIRATGQARAPRKPIG